MMKAQTFLRLPRLPRLLKTQTQTQTQTQKLMPKRPNLKLLLNLKPTNQNLKFNPKLNLMKQQKQRKQQKHHQHVKQHVA